MSSEGDRADRPVDDQALTSEERRSRTGWRRGADGDRVLAAELEIGLGDDAHVMHGLTAPDVRGDIDHLMVASSGVWVVDAKSYWGLVEQRDVGNWRTVDLRLFVNGRDQTELVDDVVWQAAAVRAALDPIGLGDVPIHPVLLFIGSGGRWFSKPIEIGGARAVWTAKLIELVRSPGPLDHDTQQTIATRLSAALPPAS